MQRDEFWVMFHFGDTDLEIATGNYEGVVLTITDHHKQIQAEVRIPKERAKEVAEMLKAASLT